MLGGCAATFLVSDECESYFFGSADEGLYKMICASGDLKKVLVDTALPQATKEQLYTYQCIERSETKVEDLYASLTKEQKKSLMFSFQKHGYLINYKPTDRYQFVGYGFDYYDSNLSFCPDRTHY